MKTIQVKYQCWSTGYDENPQPGFIPPPHPLIPDDVPPEAQRLQQFKDNS